MNDIFTRLRLAYLGWQVRSLLTSATACNIAAAQSHADEFSYRAKATRLRSEIGRLERSKGLIGAKHV